MKLKWEWFLGGKSMFWVTIVLFIVLVIGFVLTYVIDPVACFCMSKQDINPNAIQKISEDYISNLGISVNYPIKYSFVRYFDDGYEAEPGEEILLGTFHEWNGKYYIDISVDLYKGAALEEIVIHETRHMLVEYMKDEKIIDLTKYTEEIARQKSSYFCKLFNDSINLLKEKENGKI